MNGPMRRYLQRRLREATKMSAKGHLDTWGVWDSRYSTLHPTIRTLLQEQEEARQRMCSQSFDLFNIDAIAEECGVELRISVFSFIHNTDVWMNIEHVSDVAPVLKEFAKRGYHQRRKMTPATGDSSFIWHLENPRGTAQGLVDLYGRLKKIEAGEDIPAGCKLVPNGTEMITRTKYKVVCDPPLEELA